MKWANAHRWIQLNKYLRVECKTNERGRGNVQNKTPQNNNIICQESAYPSLILSWYLGVLPSICVIHVTYCCISNYGRFRNLKQHMFVCHSIYGSGAGPGLVLSSVLHKAGIKVLARLHSYLKLRVLFQLYSSWWQNSVLFGCRTQDLDPHPPVAAPSIDSHSGNAYFFRPEGGHSSLFLTSGVFFFFFKYSTN